jgi:hypothetical protein
MYDQQAWASADRLGYPGPLESRLSGTGRIADDLWLLAHDDLSGRLLLDRRGLGLGLAGGLLAELMLGRAAGLLPDGTVAAGRTYPPDEVAQRVHGLISAEEPLLVRDWLLFLAQTALEMVAGRLADAGYLRQRRSPLPGRRMRWVPVNPDWAYAPLLRVRSALDPGRPFCVPGVVLAGLAAACGLQFRISEHLPPGRTAADAAGQLSPDLRQLIAHTQAAVDVSSVLSPRT